LAVASGQTQMKPVQKVQGNLILPADVLVSYINATNCMCEKNLKRYVKTMAPKTVEVALENKSNFKVTVKLEVSWVSRYRKPGKTFEITPRTITLDPRSSKLETIFKNTYYDLMQTPNGITAKISIIGKKYRDPNPRNNTKKISECYYYMY
jgi:hypothetical protein